MDTTEAYLKWKKNRGDSPMFPDEVWRAAIEWYKSQPADVRGAEPDPAYDRYTSELLDSQEFQLEQIGNAVLSKDWDKAKKLVEEAVNGNTY